MSNVPFSAGDWLRRVAREAALPLRNRYYEENPVLANEGAAVLTRPALSRYLVVGSGPIRGIYSQSGSFEERLFVVSGSEWYAVSVVDDIDLIQTDIAGGQDTVSMAGTGNIGDVPPVMFMADGTTLWAYMDDSYATALITGTPVEGSTLRVGSVYYMWTANSVDGSGTPPDGTSLAPWLVALGGDTATAFRTMTDALNASGEAGVDYSTALTDAQKNDAARGYRNTATDMTVMAYDFGGNGNSVIVVAGAGVATTGMGGGGTPTVFAVPTPGNFGVIAVGYIASQIIVVPAQGQGVNGRFYWIRPGEVTIDPLDYATAERAPDPISGVVVFGDQFWLPGTTTTEVWYPSGDATFPFLRQEGIAFDRGAWSGTALQVKDSMIIVDTDGGVFEIAGGLKRISTPGIEERIRKAIKDSL